MQEKNGWQEDRSFLPILFALQPVVSLPVVKSQLTFTRDVRVQMEERDAIAQVHGEISSASYNTLRLSNLAKVALLHTAICRNLKLSTFDKDFTTNAFLSWFIRSQNIGSLIFPKDQTSFFPFKYYSLENIWFSQAELILLTLHTPEIKINLLTRGFLNITLIYSQQTVHVWEIKEKCWNSINIIIC